MKEPSVFYEDNANVQLARYAADRLDAGIPGPEPIHGMTLKQYDRYLHYRLVLSHVASRQMAMRAS